MKRKKLRTINWSKYNEELIKRGKITFWFDKQLAVDWYCEMPIKGGRYTKIYSESAINALLLLRYFYKLTLRETKGLALSLVDLMGLNIEIPCYTTISRRQKKISINVTSTLKDHQSVHIVVDSTGLKVYGEGEWKVRKHGIGKRRTWRKLHLAVDESNNQIMAAELTGNEKRDSEVFEKLADKSKSKKLKQISGDGAFDTQNCYKWTTKHRVKGVFPPRKGAKISQHGNVLGKRLQRDENIRGVRSLGVGEWKRKNNYHRRSISETAMFRFKEKFTHNIKSRNFNSQVNECLIKCNILNRLPTPNFLAIHSPP